MFVGGICIAINVYPGYQAIVLGSPIKIHKYVIILKLLGILYLEYKTVLYVSNIQSKLGQLCKIALH